MILRRESLDLLIAAPFYSIYLASSIYLRPTMFLTILQYSRTPRVGCLNYLSAIVASLEKGRRRKRRESIGHEPTILPFLSRHFTLSARRNLILKQNNVRSETRMQVIQISSLAINETKQKYLFKKIAARDNLRYLTMYGQYNHKS